MKDLDKQIAIENLPEQIRKFYDYLKSEDQKTPDIVFHIKYTVYYYNLTLPSEDRININTIRNWFKLLFDHKLIKRRKSIKANIYEFSFKKNFYFPKKLKHCEKLPPRLKNILREVFYDGRKTIKELAKTANNRNYSTNALQTLQSTVFYLTNNKYLSKIIEGKIIYYTIHERILKE